MDQFPFDERRLVSKYAATPALTSRTNAAAARFGKATLVASTSGSSVLHCVILRPTSSPCKRPRQYLDCISVIALSYWPEWFEKPECRGAVGATANRDGSQSAELDAPLRVGHPLTIGVDICPPACNISADVWKRATHEALIPQPRIFQYEIPTNCSFRLLWSICLMGLLGVFYSGSTTRAAGQVVAWGSPVNAIPTVPATATNLIAIRAGNLAPLGPPGA